MDNKLKTEETKLNVTSKKFNLLVDDVELFFQSGFM